MHAILVQSVPNEWAKERADCGHHLSHGYQPCAGGGGITPIVSERVLDSELELADDDSRSVTNKAILASWTIDRFGVSFDDGSC